MLNEQIRILLVEDEPAYAQLHSAMLLGGSKKQFQLTHAPSFGEAEARLAEGRFDIILLDLTLPDRAGLSTYADMKSRAPTLPIVVLTGCDDDKLALQAVRDGAQDYLIKGEMDARLLTRVIRYAIERKLLAEDLRQREEFFRHTLEHMQDLVAVLDREGCLVWASPSCRKLLGDPKQVTGTNPFGRIHADDREQAMVAFQAALLTGIGRRVDYRFTAEDGQIRHLESQGSVIFDGAGIPSKIVVVSRDITERKSTIETLREALSDLRKSHEELKATQMQLIQAERLEAVSTFAAGVAHEVKNPLQTIVFGIDYLANHGGLTDPAAPTVVAEMEKAVQHADNIIRGLLEFANYRGREVREEDLNVILEQALPAVESDIVNGRIRLMKHLGEDLPKLRIDHRTMKHVFINLFASAIRDMADGGRLSVRTYAQSADASKTSGLKLPSYFKPDDTIVVAEVEEAANRLEEAIGEPQVTPASQPSAGDPAGLGMTVLKKIIELHGGAIHAVRREPGTGKFTIVFKASSSNAA